MGPGHREYVQNIVEGQCDGPTGSVLAEKVQRPECDSGNHVKGERKELIAQSCPLVSAYVPLLHIKLPSMAEDREMMGG